MENKYQNSKIYKIVDVGYNKSYIGSTVQKLSNRMAKHRSEYGNKSMNCKSFEAFRIIPILANGGVIFSERCNDEEEQEYKDYNIIFVERKDLYSTFKKYKENINYDDILRKTLLFRNNVCIIKYLFL